MPLERNYQAKLIKKLKSLFPGCYILKNDPNYMQGIPDLVILFENKWAMLEVKKSEKDYLENQQPNQQWYIDELDAMSFAAFIFPEIEREVLDALQQAFQS